MTPIYESTYHDAMISANQAFVASEYLINNFNNNNLLYVLATTPGHHAKHAEYGGYCFFNNTMIAAQNLYNKTSKKIGILDLDYHAGNGTSELVTNNNNILAWSIHCDPVYDYPSFEGFADKYNFVVQPHCDKETYKKILINVCDIINDNKIDVLIIAFGGDTFKDDPDALAIGRFNLDINAYLEIGQVIREKFALIPKIITQEGGYNMDNIGAIVVQFISGITGTNN